MTAMMVGVTLLPASACSAESNKGGKLLQSFLFLQKLLQSACALGDRIAAEAFAEL